MFLHARLSSILFQGGGGNQEKGGDFSYLPLSSAAAALRVRWMKIRQAGRKHKLASCINGKGKSKGLKRGNSSAITEDPSVPSVRNWRQRAALQPDGA